MFEHLTELLTNRQFLLSTCAAIAAAATAWTVAMPLLSGNTLQRRMKSVAIERERIRAREREKLARAERNALRREPKAFMRQIVELFDLNKYLGTENARERLTMAGYRGQGPMVAFLFARAVTTIGVFLAALVYLFFIGHLAWPWLMKVAAAIGAAYLGLKLPEIFIRNQITKRQTSVRRAFPDALDLLLICVEAGMSVEAAFRKVSQEIGAQSVALAEEFILTTAEMAYLQDRRAAFENLGLRTGLEGVKAVSSALIQADRYGTPIGQALRVLAQENRDIRMNEAEKKAAGLPPKLTVPMIVFFLPVLFVIIMGPAIMQVMKIMK
ncbi:MAG TPA: type II secretion system F family protein [Hyphomicrobiales bacterium]|nr:type II secretion system F family protein [Hyphomicrobiales bacterium]